jgi:RND family efflux transporter MFP subunit
MVSLPVTREVTDYEEFPGRMEAVNNVSIRARVTGYLDKMHFREGADVKQGDLLFEIDPRSYDAELARAEANIVQSEARLNRLEADAARATTLLGRGAIGREEFDKIIGDRKEAAAAVGVAKANRDLASLNVSFTKVRSPLTGKISRRYLDPGNMVKGDDTVLTTVASLDPIFAYFDLDERTTLRLQRLIREKKIEWSQDGKLPVLLGMADEEGFPQKGVIDFADIMVDGDTGTWRLRGKFPNADHALSPGLFVRIRLPIGNAYRATLVSEQALGTDQGQKFLYVVKKGEKKDEKGNLLKDDNGDPIPVDEVEYRRVKVGRLHDGLRVISDGLKPGEKVIVSGLQQARPGIAVNPKVVDMPVVGANSHEGSGVKTQESEIKPRPAKLTP